MSERLGTQLQSGGLEQSIHTGLLGRGMFAGASLDLNFAATKNIGPLVTFTRASTATFIDSVGVLQTAVADVPRFDHNPTTGESLGLLVEEARTNSIRNNTMVGAVAGTPGTLPTNWAINGVGTLTQQIVGVGVDNGINYFDVRFSGTTSTTQLGFRFETTNGAAGANGQTFTYATWLARVAGSLTNIISISCNANLYDAGLVYLTTPAFNGFDATTNGTSFIRRAGTLTIASATAAFIQPQLAITFNSGVAIDITLRIGLPQLEQGAFATSVIPTTTAAATRSADVASITGTNFSSWFNQTQGTTYTSAQVGYTVPGSFFPIVAAMNDGTSANRLEFGYLTATLAGFGVVLGGVDQGSVYPSTTAVVRNLGCAYQSSNGATSVNGGGVLTLGSMGVPAVNQLTFGRTPAAGSVLNGTIRRLTYWPQRLANSTLQAITQ